LRRDGAGCDRQKNRRRNQHSLRRLYRFKTHELQAFRYDTSATVPIYFYRAVIKKQPTRRRQASDFIMRAAAAILNDPKVSPSALFREPPVTIFWNQLVG
jgi:hypothetical protein